MNYLEKAILKKYEKHWFTLRDAGFITNLKEADVLELQLVYQKEIDANYFVNKWCNSCVAEMIRILYLATKYDTLQEEKFTDAPEVKEFIQALDEAEQQAVVIEEPKPQPQKRGRKKKS